MICARAGKVEARQKRGSVGRAAGVWRAAAAAVKAARGEAAAEEGQRGVGEGGKRGGGGMSKGRGGRGPRAAGAPEALVLCGGERRTPDRGRSQPLSPQPVRLACLPTYCSVSLPPGVRTFRTTFDFVANDMRLR